MPNTIDWVKDSKAVRTVAVLGELGRAQWELAMACFLSVFCRIWTHKTCFTQTDTAAVAVLCFCLEMSWYDQDDALLSNSVYSSVPKEYSSKLADNFIQPGFSCWLKEGIKRLLVNQGCLIQTSRNHTWIASVLQSTDGSKASTPPPFRPSLKRILRSGAHQSHQSAEVWRPWRVV